MNRHQRAMTGCLLLLVLYHAACTPWIASADNSFQSIGTPGNGLLSSASPFSFDPRFSIDYRKQGRSWGTHALVALVEDTAQQINAAFPLTRLMIGDFSAESGGFISEHASHRTGRDVDFAFFLMNMKGEPVSATPLVPIDRFGIGLRGSRIVRFDVARNWAVVKSLLQSEMADVQWIFVSAALKAMMLAHAIDHRESPDIVDKALRVLHQPSDSSPHDDHFHVRIFCPRGDAGAFCQPTGPARPWRRQTSIDVMTDNHRMKLALDALSSP